jgi:hypothetical protein
MSWIICCSIFGSTAPPRLEQYMERAGRVSDLNFLTPTDQGKHFRATLSKEDVDEASTDGPSLFWVNYNSDRLKSIVWTWFQVYFDSLLAEESSSFFVYPMIVYRRLNDPDNEPDEDLRNTPVGRLWQKFLKETNLRLCMNTLQPLGACHGVLTSYLGYGVHMDAKTVQC